MLEKNLKVLFCLVVMGIYPSTLSAKKNNLRVRGLPFFVLSSAMESPLLHVEWMFRPSNFVNLGPSLSMSNRTEEKGNRKYKQTSYEGGMRADFVLGNDGFSSGFYLSNEMLLGYLKTQEDTVFTAECIGEFGTTALSVKNLGAFGYQLFWPNGYNIAAGIGYSISRPALVGTTLKSSCAGTLRTFDHGNYEKLFLDISFGIAF